MYESIYRDEKHKAEVFVYIVNFFYLFSPFLCVNVLVFDKVTVSGSELSQCVFCSACIVLPV